MLMEGRTYTQLLNEIDLLKNDNFMLRTENQLLADELIRQRERRMMSEIKQKQNLEKSQALHVQYVGLQQKNKTELVARVQQLQKERTAYLQKKFQEMSNSSFGKLKNLEVTMTKTRIQNTQLSEFIQKIKKLYKQKIQNWQAQNINSSKKTEPTLKDLRKWIKYLAQTKEQSIMKPSFKKTTVSNNGSVLSTKNN